MKPLKITRFVRKLDPTFHRKAFDLNKKSLKISKGQSETYIEEEWTTQWRKEKVQKDKQRSTKRIYI
jgi:hypothetical protein